MRETPLRGKRVVVQRYGETNRELQAALESEGAEVIEIVTYRWALPADTAPLLKLIGALDRNEIDLVAFTSASQAANLFDAGAIHAYLINQRCPPFRGRVNEGRQRGAASRWRTGRMVIRTR
jgi:uroporphyrinogen-III synthase